MLKFLLSVIMISFWQMYSAQVIETTEFLNIDYSKLTIRTRIQPPAGFTWTTDKADSFSTYLTHFPLFPPNFPVRYYDLVPIEKQNHHVAILKIDVGNKDLQQCADAWMRLYAEYLWKFKRFDEIKFEFTSGQMFAWNDYKHGVRTKEDGKFVIFYNIPEVDDSYQNFRQYLNVIFNYAGTISLNKESVAVNSNDEIKAGDFIIKPGSPGHTVIVVGVSKNSKGKKLYLLAESFMPAQDVHILVNHQNKTISPWYELDINAPETVTAKYVFRPTSIKRFYAIP